MSFAELWTHSLDFFFFFSFVFSLLYIEIKQVAQVQSKNEEHAASPDVQS